MITANELRIGNFIDDNGIGAITKISEKTIEINGDGGERALFFIKPIPINEEWIKRCGFASRGNLLAKEHSNIEYLMDGEFKEDESFILTKNNDSDDGGFDVCRLENYVMTVHFVHQLQNLFFALRGKELEIETVREQL